MFSGSEIANIQISALESLKVENRLNYYDHVGAVKDMLQSHLIQLLSLVVMDLPYEINGDSIGSAKENVVDNLIVDQAIFGQYEDYCHRNNFTCSPFTETMFAGKLFLNKQEWQNVPIYVRSGKALDRKQTSVVIEFKKYAHQEDSTANKLIFEISPNPSMRLCFNGTETESEIVTAKQLDCGENRCLSSHAMLFMDALHGQKEYFVSFKQAISSWKITEKFLENKKLFRYESGIGEVTESSDLISKDGFKWVNIYE